MTITLYRPLRRKGGFETMLKDMQTDMMLQSAVEVGEWQSRRIEQKMLELRNVSFAWNIPDSQAELAAETGAHLPWAEDHFQERVSGEPMNPAPSEAWWPFAKKSDKGTNADHKSEGEAFSHTYPERMWPKFTGLTYENSMGGPARGIRFDYGDLGDVINQLVRSPFTRQAYLPIWFPEDTGAVHGKRVPCTLGYHFAIREGKLDITYYMRSTDLIRHFQDDIYLAGRLAQHVADKVNDGMQWAESAKLGWDENPMLAMIPDEEKLQVGELIFHTANLHVFEQDRDLIKYRQSQGQIL